MGGLLQQQRDDTMELRPYFDRPQAVIQEYLVQIDEFIRFAYPNWGASNRGIWCKGEFGRGTLRADHFSILDTQGQWIVPNSSLGTTGSKTAASTGWIDKALDFKTLEELYTLVLGYQYPVSPITITEGQWAIAGITTPVYDKQVVEILEEPLVYFEEPLVVEPEKTIAWNLRIKTASGSLSNEKMRVVGMVVGQHHELIQQTENSSELT